MTDNKVLERIKKLLNLADASKNSSPEEAAAAASKVQELLFQYKLSMSAVENHQSVVPEEYVKQDSTLRSNRNTLGWHRALVFTLADTHFCKALYLRGHHKMILIGKPHDIDIIEYLYDYLSKELERLAEEAIRRERPFHTRGWRGYFCHGAVVTIRERLMQDMRRREHESSQSTALVKVEKEGLTKAVNKMYPRLGKSTAYSGGGGRPGFDQGKEAGRHVGLRKGVSSTSSKGQLR